MKRLFILLLMLTGIVCMVRAQDFSKVDSWLDVNTRKMGGKSVLLIEKDGKIVYSKEINEKEDTRQRIASCSKWLSAALVMAFVDEGKLRLEDTVGKYLPVLSAHGKGNITVKECLSHLTGIQEPSMWRSIAEMRGIRTMDEAIEKIAAMPMEGEPGKVFHYSNAGLQIAGAILEKIGGEPFGQLFIERIAKPLGMTNTDFGDKPVALPAGGASSTAQDYLRFLEMIRNKGVYHGVRVLSVKSVEEMEKNRIGPDVRIGYTPVGEVMGKVGYGYGEWIIIDAAGQ